MSINNKHPEDKNTKSIEDTLRLYDNERKRIKIDIYRYNCASIRVRIVDPSFKKLSNTQRENLVWGYLNNLEKDARNEITMLLLITPEEKIDPFSFMNREFDEPSPSRL